MISVDLSMETMVGDLVIVTARVMNQKASRVITADTGRQAAEISGKDGRSVSSLLGRNTEQTRERRTENTPDINIRWTVVILSFLATRLTFTTSEMAAVAAAVRQMTTPRV